MSVVRGAAVAAAAAAGLAAFVRCRTRSSEASAWSALAELIHSLPRCRAAAESLDVFERTFRQAFGMPVAILLREGSGFRVLHHTRGLNTDLDRLHRMEFRTAAGISGALAFPFEPSARPRPILQAFADLASIIAAESVPRDTGRLQKALLNSIAHNLRTPLASIMGVLTTLEEDDAVLNPALRGDLVDTAREEADRLNRLLGNLLDLSRIESGAVEVRIDDWDVEDLIGAALEKLGSGARRREIRIDIAAGLPPVPMDFVLIVQVLVNVIDNAMKYSAQEAPIRIGARVRDNELEIAVTDEGEGIEEKDLPYIFEKFNRAGRTGETGGIGLGLSICRSLVEAHRGTIRAERCEPRGTRVEFRLPLSAAATGACQ